MERLMFYLWMPTPYLHLLNARTQGKSGELRWASGGDAIEDADGTTFLFTPQLGKFLEGFARVRSLIHFGHILHLLYYLVKKDKHHPDAFQSLHAAFQQTGRRLENAGALCGYLCSEIPPVPGPIDPGELVRFLSSPARMAEFVARPPGISERAPLLPEAFEEKVCRTLRTMPYNELEHWLRHGRGSLTQPAAQIARELDTARPRTLAGVLAALAQRQRFAGAIPYVGQLVSALALPPRRLVRQQLATGGYADVGTHGHPEQILPSQFALDELEFLRRFADHELLYFRREEPHRQTREDLVLLLDQGVRTWGDVRLVLSAAVLAFGKNAARRNMPLRLAATSGGGTLVDPLQAEDAALGEMLEASDLSPNPGLALEQVLAEKAEAGRDIVLLTHPRSLAEPDVTAAARRLQPGMRLFAVAVDEAGAVQLAEIRHGTPVKLGQFQVDLSLGHQVKHRPQAPAATVPPEPLPPWTGYPEPIPFPFRFGPQGRIDKIAFDHDGEWVVLGDQKGMLYAFRVDGTHAEVLPRVLIDGGCFLQRADALLGVAGGVVAVGRINCQLVALYYDFCRRWCQAHILGSSRIQTGVSYEPLWNWFYLREYHAIVADLPGIVAATGPDVSRGVDLASGETSGTTAHRSGAPGRAQEACAAVKKYLLPPPNLPIVRDRNLRWGHSPCLCHDKTTGMIHVQGIEEAWEPVLALADGQPILRDVVPDQALCQDNILAITCRSPRDVSRTLHLLQMPNGVPLAEFQLSEFFHQFALSGDGRLLARQTGQSRVEIREIGDLAHRRLLTTSGRFHPDCTVILGRDWFVVEVGNFRHILDWRSGELVITEDKFGKLGSVQSLEIARRSPFIKAEARYLPASVHYDTQRFLAAATIDLTVVVDAYGQLALFAESRLLCMFFIFRHQVAGWTPDGIRFGPASMSQGPETAGALQKIGRLLKEAAVALSE